MELMTYKTRAVRTLSLLILVALLAALNPPSLTDSSAFAQTATVPELDSSADTANQVDLSWTAVTDADDYELWRWETSEGWVEVDDSIEGTSYSDTGVTAGNTYYYQVSADGGSTWSNRVNETVGAYDASTLAAPTVTSSSVSLSWSAVTGATSYALWRFETSWAQVGGALTGTTYTDTSVEIGKTYYYQVMANGPNGDGAWSNRVEAVVPTTTPGAPLNFTATPGDAQVSLSWDPPTSDGGEALTGYQYRYQAVGGTWSGWMATAPALSRTATVTGLANETNHNFEVQAVNSNGAGATAADSATPMSTVPGIPSGLGTTSTGPTEITLSWSAVTGAASYQLQRRTNGGAWGSPMDAGSGTTYTDTGLDPSTTYDYEVRSVNTAGSSGWSGVVTASTTAATAPDAVSDLAASAGASSITLTWSAPDSNGADITGYTIEVSDDGSTGWANLASPAASATSYEHMNLGPGTTKHYRITATNSVGTSDASSTAMASVAAVAPGKPVLTATADGSNTITLSWIAPADTGGAPITGYTLQVSSNGTTGWTNRTSPAADATSYDHTGLAAGTTRYYRISARNSAGSGDWSDVDSATTTGAEPPRGETPDGSSPQNLRVTPQSLAADAGVGVKMTSILIEWDAPTSLPQGRTLNDDGDGATFNDAYRVEVWNGSTQAWDPVTDDATTSVDEQLLDSGLTGTTKYTYRVVAIFDDDSMGKYSTQESATTVAVSPAMPMLTATSMGTDKIMLSWTVANDGGSDVVNYELQVAPDSAGSPGTWREVEDDESTADGGDGTPDDGEVTTLAAVAMSYTHGMLSPATTFHYRVRAVNTVVDPASTPTGGTAGENAAKSDWSDTKSATTGMGVPGMPTINRADTNNDGTIDAVDNSTGGQLTFTWAAPATNGGAEITAYILERLDGNEWVLIREADQNTLNYQDGDSTNSPLAGMVTRHYRVAARNANGVGPWAEASGTTAAGVPSAPKLAATVNGPNSITLSWTRPANGGSDITGYTIQVPNADGSDFIDATDTDLTGLTSPSTLTATDEELTAGTAMRYRIVAVNGVGNSQPSNEVTATTSMGGVPGAPTWDTTAALTPAPTSVTINWVAPQVGAADDPSVTGYDIAMWVDGQWTVIASNIATDPTEYVESGLSGDTTYYFSVRARSANGVGAWSIVRSTTTLAGAPGKPVLTATPDGATKIVLTWTAPEDGGRAITNYLVQVSNNGTAGWGPLQASPGTDDYQNTADITGIGVATNVVLPAGSTDPAPPLTVSHDEDITGLTRKFYRVLAANGTVTDAVNRGMWSDVKSATTPAGKPAIVVLEVAPTPELADKFVISWMAPANGGSAITGYQIQIWEDGAWADLETVGGSMSSYTHEPIPGATTNYYRVRAMNAVGYGPWSTSQSRTTVAGRPGAPELHASENGTTEIRLTWTAPATGEAAGATGITNYQIQVSDDGQTAWTAPETSTTIVDGQRVHQTVDDTNTGDVNEATMTNYTHSSLDPSTTKHYRVRAVNGQGVGPWSNVAMATTTGGTPGRPELNATASGTSMINLAWTPPEGDGGSAITGYEIEYWDGSNGWMALTSTGASVTSHTHRNIAGGTTKYYRIRALNSGGNGLWSTVEYATTATAAPSPPTLTAMADGATKIELTWTAGHDGGLTITRYHLQHSTNAGGTWADINNNIMSTMMMSHTDMDGLTGGVTKHYRIRAMNSKGWSGWSPLASATTARSAPGKATLTAVGLTRGRILLDWEAASGGSTITRYELQKWDSSKRRWEDLSTTTAMSYTDSGLTAGTRYYYRVRAVNAMGEGDWSTFAYSTPTN